jgi:hydroxyethylthiazole kinase-like uncharacterized protein yjeF
MAVDAYATTVVQQTVARVLDSGVPHDSLMHRAAAGLAVVCAQELRRRYGGVYGRRVVLLVGSGNNGADALFAGARLRRRGARVDAVLVGKSVYQPGVRALTAARGRLLEATTDSTAAQAAIERADLLVDGIVGDRGRGGLRGPAADIAGVVAELAVPVPVVAADLPSGVDPDTGELPGPFIPADVTVTFGAAKPCLLLPPACHHAGRLVVVDVGLPGLPVRERIAQRWDLETVADEWPVPDTTSHKYSRGVLGVVAGSDRYPGAAVLSCLGAVRTGVGMVRYVGPPTATDHVLAATPEAVAGSGRVQAWLLGPGVEPGTHQHAAIAAALDSGAPCVVDAGALAACVPRRARGDRAAAANHVLLTPHAGELAELLCGLGHDVAREDVEERPAHFARLLATEADATVLLKGSTTLIVGPAGPFAAAQQAPSWLATAGAGDVLAGIAGALLATGSSAYFAGHLAAIAHGRAARRACPGGPVSARTVAEAVPATVAEILAFRRLPS